VFYKSCCVKVENESLNSLALVLMIFSMILLKLKKMVSLSSFTDRDDNLSVMILACRVKLIHCPCRACKEVFTSKNTSKWVTNKRVMSMNKKF
jgi:hypothetical protein